MRLANNSDYQYCSTTLLSWFLFLSLHLQISLHSVSHIAHISFLSLPLPHSCNNFVVLQLARLILLLANEES
jgi:hypothetical protein